MFDHTVIYHVDLFDVKTGNPVDSISVYPGRIDGIYYLVEEVETKEKEVLNEIKAVYNIGKVKEDFNKNKIKCDVNIG